MIIRACPRSVASAKAAVPAPEGTTLAPTWQSAISRPSSSSAEKRASPRRAMSSRKTRSIGSSAQKASTWSSVGVTVRMVGSSQAEAADSVRVAAMPLHVRAEPGDYAEAVLLPGDPLRAKYIADTYLEDVVQTNAERGMLGYRGTWEGKPVSVQSTGMGCPSAAIVIEELVMLGLQEAAAVSAHAAGYSLITRSAT